MSRPDGRVSIGTLLAVGLAVVVLGVVLFGLPSASLWDDGSSQSQDAAPPRPQDTEDVGMLFRAGPCDGNCPAFRLEVCGNGTVFYTGFSDVNVTGTYRYEISESDVRAVLDAAYRTEYFSLDEDYRAQADGFPTYRTVVRVGDERHAVTASGEAPGSLRTFHNELLEHTDVKRLVDGSQDMENGTRAKKLSEADPRCV